MGCFTTVKQHGGHLVDTETDINSPLSKNILESTGAELKLTPEL